MENHYAIAGAIVVNVLADSGDDAGSFVSEDARRGMGAGGNLLEVGAADAAGVNADENFSGTDFGDGDSFEADVVHAAVDCGQHGRRNRAF